MQWSKLGGFDGSDAVGRLDVVDFWNNIAASSWAQGIYESHAAVAAIRKDGSAWSTGFVISS